MPQVCSCPRAYVYSYIFCAESGITMYEFKKRKRTEQERIINANSREVQYTTWRASSAGLTAAAFNPYLTPGQGWGASHPYASATPSTTHRLEPASPSHVAWGTSSSAACRTTQCVPR